MINIYLLDSRTLRRILSEPFKDTQIGFANFFQNDTNNLTDDYYKSAVYKFDRNFRPRSEKKLRIDLSEKYRDLNDKDNPRPKLRSGGSRPSVSFEICLFRKNVINFYLKITY